MDPVFATHGERRLFEILHEDAELLVINKPAGLVCHPTKTDEYSSLISRVLLHLGPETPAHLINRLDRETSGVILVGKEEKAVRELRRLWERRQVKKEYFAIAHGHPASNHALISEPLGKDEASIVTIKDTVVPGGAPSETEFWVEKNFSRAEGEFSLLRVVPHTGRKHQIRIHLAHIGHPIVGDKMYGKDPSAYLCFVYDLLTPEQRAGLILPWQALHAAALEFDWRDTPMRFTAPPEDWFSEFCEM